MITGAENYTVKAFMTSAMGLRGAELQVYALIYSFSHDGVGEFSGSREYIAVTTGTSERTVTRALSSLTEKGLLKRRRFPHNTSYIYSADLDSVRSACEKRMCQIGISQSSERQNVHGQNDEGERTIWRSETDKMSTNNKEDNKEIINTTAASAAGRVREEKTENGWKKPEKSWLEADVSPIPIKKIPWEKYGLGFFMTEEQFEHLDALVSNDEILFCYFGRLRQFMDENPRAKIHSPYRVLLRWIKEDFAAEVPK